MGVYNDPVGAFHFFHPIEVRYGDLDPQGHVNNAVYMTYYEQARVAYLRHLGLWDGSSFQDLGIILAEASITFKKPIYFGQEIRVGVRVSRLGNKSLIMEYSLRGKDGEEYSRASTVLVAYDYKNGTSISIPRAWREAIAAIEELPSSDIERQTGE